MSAAVALKEVPSMKAVVFCNFPERLAAQLRHHLEEWGIDILHFGALSAATEMRDPGTDMVIAFIEIMSHGQSNQAKALAARWGARFVPLSRKMSSWIRFLPNPLPRPVPPVMPAVVGEDTGITLEPVYEMPPAPASDEAPVSMRDPIALEQQWEEIRDLFADEVEALKKKVEGLEAENHNLKLQLSSSQMTEAEIYALATDEEKRLKSRISQLEGEVEKRDQELRQAAEKMKQSSLESLGGAIRTLVDAGILEEREAADRLLNLVLGQRR